MASILDLLNTRNGELLVAKAVERTSEDKEQVTTVLAVGMPVLLGATKKNIGSKDGELNLNKVLDEDKFEEDLLTDFDSKDAADLIRQGDLILDRIFGVKKESVISLISTTLGVNDSSVADILKMVAPVVISILASQRKNQKLDSTAFGELINSLLGASGKFDPSFIEAMLAGKGDAKIIKDAEGMILGGGNKGKKDGGLLGGMVGGK